MKKIEEILKEAYPFLEKVMRSLFKDDIDVSAYQLDHICYRVETTEKYQQHQQQFTTVGTLLSEAYIAGRMISTYKLQQPIHFQERDIFLVEIPSPKEGYHYPEGFEHVEFVINEPFEEFMKKYPTINFNTKAMRKERNPDVSIAYGGFTVKFHQKSLEKVIEEEKVEKS